MESLCLVSQTMIHSYEQFQSYRHDAPLGPSCPDMGGSTVAMHYRIYYHAITNRLHKGLSSN
jgi:hypothetical protein